MRRQGRNAGIKILYFEVLYCSVLDVSTCYEGVSEERMLISSPPPPSFTSANNLAIDSAGMKNLVIL